MPWFKVDDQFAFHHKVIAAGNAAAGLWVRAGSFCSQQLTDGFVPDHMLVALGTKGQAKALVDVGLWHRVEGGYVFHEWNDPGRQPTREQVEHERSQARERMANKRRNTNGEFSGRSADVRANTSRTADEVTEGVRPPRPDPTIEVPNGTSPGPRNRAARGTRLPAEWQPDADLVAWARAECPDVDGRRETERFRDHWLSKSGKDATKIDWARTWKNWMRTAQDRAARTAGRPAAAQAGPPEEAWMRRRPEDA